MAQKITQTDLRLQFTREEGLQYPTVVDNIARSPKETYGNIYPIMYINWLEDKLIEEWNKQSTED